MDVSAQCHSLVLDNCRATIERCVIFELRAKNELKSRLFFVSFVAAVAAFGASVTVLGSRIVHANLQEDDLGGQQLQKPPVEQHILKITRRVLCCLTRCSELPPRPSGLATAASPDLPGCFPRRMALTPILRPSARHLRLRAMMKSRRCCRR